MYLQLLYIDYGGLQDDILYCLLDLSPLMAIFAKIISDDTVTYNLRRFPAPLAPPLGGYHAQLMGVLMPGMQVWAEHLP